MLEDSSHRLFTLFPYSHLLLCLWNFSLYMNLHLLYLFLKLQLCNISMVLTLKSSLSMTQDNSSYSAARSVLRNNKGFPKHIKLPEQVYNASSRDAEQRQVHDVTKNNTKNHFSTFPLWFSKSFCCFSTYVRYVSTSLCPQKKPMYS